MLKNLYGQKGPRLSQAELNKILALLGPATICRGGPFARLKGADLDGLNLANRTLREADFSGTSFVDANLSGSNLARASLYCADLRGCNLQNSDLTGADIRGASFKGAKLSYAVLDFADLRAGMMMCVRPGSVSILDRGDPDGKLGADFSNCRMINASLGNARLEQSNFDGAVMAGVRFKGAVLTGASFRGTVLTGVNLQELAVPPEALAECVVDVSASAVARSVELKEKIDAHHAWATSDGKQGAAAVLDGEDLRPLCKDFAGKCLAGLSARRVIAIGVDFSKSELQGAKFEAADLRDANFTGADLSGVSLSRAKLAHARFDRAKLCSLRLLNGDTIPPNLAGAEATEAQFQRASLDSGLSAIGLFAA